MAVEFALLMPILVMLLLGLVTAGVAYSQAIGLANAVREGSRFGATAAAPTGVALNWDTWKVDVVARTRSVQADDPGATSTICVQLTKNNTSATAVPATVLATNCSNGLATAAAAPTPPAIPSNTCFVAVWGTRKYHINALLLNFDGTMERHSLAQYERTC